MQRILDTTARLHAYAQDNGVYDDQALLPEARRLLAQTEARVLEEMQRNVFIAGGGRDE
jgi:hypothetical protein